MQIHPAVCYDRSSDVNKNIILLLPPAYQVRWEVMFHGGTLGHLWLGNAPGSAPMSFRGGGGYLSTSWGGGYPVPAVWYPSLAREYPSPILGVPQSQSGNTPGQGYPPPGRDRGTPSQDRTEVPLPGTEVPLHWWLVTPWAVCLLWFPAGGLSCYVKISNVQIYLVNLINTKWQKYSIKSLREQKVIRKLFKKFRKLF